MKKTNHLKYLRNAFLTIVTAGILSTGVALAGGPASDKTGSEINNRDNNTINSNPSQTISAADPGDALPVYGNWKTFTTKDGLPSDHTYAVRIDGDRVWVGTHDGLALYENGKWRTFTTKDGLPHNGVIAIDIDKETGDLWIGTL
ncbi:MAG TPA: hypothetical protein VJ963_03150, partial [Bacteroidales bacterium]|nr:hypothetical protein [Bacteroidales bacterium]